MIFLQTLYTEFLKLRRTKITWIVAALFSIAPLAIAFMVYIIMNPELADNLGLITAKAELTIGSADWATYLDLMKVITSVGGIVSGFVFAFVFGREYMNGTAKNMLSLALPRGLFVTAKLIVAAAWYCAIMIVINIEAFIWGAVFGIPGFSASLVGPYLSAAAQITIQTLLLCSLIAWVSILGKGFLAPIGYSIFTFLAFGQIFVHTGWAEWCPWSIPLVQAGAGSEGAAAPGIGSWIVLIVVFIAGTFGAIYTLDKSDNTQ